MGESDAEPQYTRRNEIEEARSPIVLRAFRALQDAIAETATLSAQLRREVFTIASIGGGCRHCQSHGGFSLAKLGVDTARIQALWDYETSTLFTEAERTAYRFALRASQVPNAVTPHVHAELREHYSDAEIAELLLQISLAGWLNRWNDSLATVTDQESVDWATEHLSPVGWEVGKHVGTQSEQRKGSIQDRRRRENEEWAKPTRDDLAP